MYRIVGESPIAEDGFWPELILRAKEMERARRVESASPSSSAAASLNFSYECKELSGRYGRGTSIAFKCARNSKETETILASRRDQLLVRARTRLSRPEFQLIPSHSVYTTTVAAASPLWNSQPDSLVTAREFVVTDISLNLLRPFSRCLSVARVRTRYTLPSNGHRRDHFWWNRVDDERLWSSAWRLLLFSRCSLIRINRFHSFAFSALPSSVRGAECFNLIRQRGCFPR